MNTLCQFGITVGAWIAEHTVIAHPVESTEIMLALIGWIAWMSIGDVKHKQR